METTSFNKRVFLLITVFSFYIIDVLAQDKNFRPTYVYKGYIETAKGNKIDINLNFLILLDSTIVGSYYYDQQNGSLSLVGKLYDHNRFRLVERDKNNVITGNFSGTLSKGNKSAVGSWIAANQARSFKFELNESKDQSYWYYIKKNRQLFEYTDFKSAIKHKQKVLSIDVARKELNTIPSGLAELDKIVSINLLGNRYREFPKVLSELTSLEEISLSSNELKYVGPEIGKLKNLRILIMNFNKLKVLPKEIGELQNLLYLELGRNQLTHLPDEIKYLTNLQELHIENNELSEVEKEKIRKALPKCVIHF